MNELQAFNHEQFGSIRTITENGKTLFCGKDVATALGYENPTKAIRDHCKTDGGLIRYPIVDALGRTQEAAFITEGNVYRLIARSRLPAAEQFESWIFDEVLPTIHKHGAYLTPSKIEEVLLNPDTIISLATQLKAEQEQRKALESKVEQDKPKVLFAAAVETAKTSILVGEFAKILKQNGVDMGQNRFFEWLRENGYLIKRKGTDWNMPTQRSMEAGLFEIKETAIAHADGHTSINKTTKVTGKGQTYFAGIFLAESVG